MDISDFTAEVIIQLEKKKIVFISRLVRGGAIVNGNQCDGWWGTLVEMLGVVFLAKQCEELANNINAIIVRNVGRTSINCQDTGY